MIPATHRPPLDAATHGAAPSRSALIIDPPSAQQARNNYTALLQRLLDNAPHGTYDSVTSLYSLTEGDLQIILQQRPELFHEAIADSMTIGRVITHFLGHADRHERRELLGMVLINSIWDYVRPLLLVDLQEEMERRQSEGNS